MILLWTGVIAAGYMEWYVSVMGDHHPESARILLPLGISLADIYKDYCHAYPAEDQIGYHRFLEIWKKNHKNVSYQRVSQFNQQCNNTSIFIFTCIVKISLICWSSFNWQTCKMSKCDVCVLAKHVLQQDLHPEDRRAVEADRREHLLRTQWVYLQPK